MLISALRSSGNPIRALALLVLLVTLQSCQAPRPVQRHKAVAELSSGLRPWPSVDAWVDPPAGWSIQPLKRDSRHTHEIWISPSGNTAYGVIYFNLPLPVSADFVLPFFIEAMRLTEGNAGLLWHEYDPKLPGVRFEAEGGAYRIQAYLVTAGFHGWAVYAGRLRDKPLEISEFRHAQAARDKTQLGLK
ncbi:MAG TPA: hypothetical protein VG722_00605 [Tepidisphaeraceae bacterium]|nr:hypothetical protein [Tepidisphaeraceae bacterium]